MTSRYRGIIKIANSWGNIVGELTDRLKSKNYAADITLLDPSSKEWIDGNITTASFWGKEYVIHMNGKYLIMKSKPDLTTEFYEKSRGERLAQFKKRPWSRLWAARFDIDIFSLKFPETLYMLALVVNG
ncbi:unnamed protein product [Rotaria sordida]|uniref:Uncharacterized protein n=1 Tax=Rotaria sordida TaxID=392033 RepID=A0A815SDM0_9BILA|nr:unnamed protein product [Rotaria sordida]CAF1188721.1 unnamed protein product [Rotaria sordida]CAF1210720.1 unnamed protein product [Rotaria sordida]CAF1487537.1 unnamed protein product [Rotaria sordida]CAF3603371.1 unnamed protein product [Rotaria sordida]